MCFTGREDSTIVFRLFFIFCDFYSDAGVVYVSVVELFDGVSGVFVYGHLCEAESFGFACGFV